MNRILSTLIVLVVLLMLLFGPSAAQDETSTWDAIMERGTIRLGVTPAEPWYFKDPQSGEWSGFGVLMGQQIAEAMGVELEPVEVTWATAVAALQANQIDTMFVLDPTPARAMSIDFPAQPLLYYALAVMHRDDMTVSSWDDLDSPDTEIGVTIGTSIDSYLTNNLQNASINRFQNNDETVASFQAGRTDAVVMFHPALTMMQQRVGQGTISLPQPVQFNISSAGVRREEDKTWRDFLTTTLMFYYNSGTTQALYDQYLESKGIDPSSVPPIMLERFSD